MTKINKNTAAKLNVKHANHSWTVRTVGYPEIKYLRQLLNILDSNRFCYRIINATRKETYYVDPTKTYDDVRDIYIQHKQVIHEGFDTSHKKYIWSKTTGAIVNWEFDNVIRVLVYKNTTRFDVVTR